MNSGLYYIFTVIFGVIFGSFLNAYIWRLKSNRSILRGRSICTHCKHDLGWLDLIPIISFLFLRGRCRYCGKKISWQYPLVELFTALIFILILNAHFNLGHSFWFIARDWFFAGILIVIFVYDHRWGYILDRVSLPSIVIAFTVNILLGYDWSNLLGAALIGCGFFLIQYLLSHGKWIGGGDIRMGALMGFMLGWPNVIVALFLSYLIGAGSAMILLFTKKKKMGSTIAMGTFLAIGSLITLLWGNQILEWYLKF